MLDQIKTYLSDRAKALDVQHAEALKRNNPTLHPLAIAIRIEEVQKMIAFVNSLEA